MHIQMTIHLSLFCYFSLQSLILLIYFTRFIVGECQSYHAVRQLVQDEHLSSRDSFQIKYVNNKQILFWSVLVIYASETSFLLGKISLFVGCIVLHRNNYPTMMLLIGMWISLTK